MKYYQRIDGLRCVAISLVLIEHFAKFIGRHISAGFYGVDLFFVISGFLITSILLKPDEKSIKRSYGNFLGRRALRIFPIYYLTIFILYIFHFPSTREQIIPLVTYTYNYAWANSGMINTPINHFWSLSVEEQFYVFWPFIILFLKRRPVALTCIVCLVIIAGYSQMIFGIIPSLIKYKYVGIFTRMGSLGLGALGALLTRFNRLPEKLLKNPAVEYLMLIILMFSLLSGIQVKVLLLGICSLFLVLKAANFGFSFKPLETFLNNKIVVGIGLVSYGIYIFHLPLSYLISTYFFDPVWGSIDFTRFGIFEKLKWHSWILKFPIYSLLTITLAKISYRFIESPILKLKNKLFN